MENGKNKVAVTLPLKEGLVLAKGIQATRDHAAALPGHMVNPLIMHNAWASLLYTYMLAWHVFQKQRYAPSKGQTYSTLHQTL